MGISTWSRGSQTILNWLFPPRCAGCGSLGTVWCSQCDAKTRKITTPLCSKCGLTGHRDRCPACTMNEYAFSAARSWAAYSGELRRAILGLKHRRNEALGEEFAKRLLGILGSQDWGIDIVIPIPLEKERLLQRGFNQADLLARPLAEATSLVYSPGALRRTRSTLPQFELGASERWENLRSSFEAESSAVNGKKVLLVDDIMTTGATLDAAAIALRESGAMDVYGLTLARSLFEGDVQVW